MIEISKFIRVYSSVRYFSEKPTSKKNVLLTFGFVGSRYFGLQMVRNQIDNVPTVEQQIMIALRNCGYITELNSSDPKKVGLSRSSRTDKGVHALRTSINLKLLVPKFFDSNKLVKDVNEQLPRDIRIFSAHIMNGSFDSKNGCSARAYDYLLPLSMLPSHSIPHLVKLLQNTLDIFVGTHSFHNFSVIRKPSGDTTAPGSSTPPHAANDDYRTTIYYIKVHEELVSIPVPTSIDRPIDILGSCSIRSDCRGDSHSLMNKRSFLRISINGKSFLYHQIRLMIGSALATCWGSIPISLVHTALHSRSRIPMPLAPAEGLGCMDSWFMRNFNGPKYVTNQYEFRIESNLWSANHLDSLYIDRKVVLCSCLYGLGARTLTLQLKLTGDSLTSEEFLRNCIYPTVGVLFDESLTNKWLMSCIHPAQHSNQYSCLIVDGACNIKEESEVVCGGGVADQESILQTIQEFIRICNNDVLNTLPVFSKDICRKLRYDLPNSTPLNVYELFNMKKPVAVYDRCELSWKNLMDIRNGLGKLINGGGDAVAIDRCIDLNVMLLSEVQRLQYYRYQQFLPANYVLNMCSYFGLSGDSNVIYEVGRVLASVNVMTVQEKMRCSGIDTIEKTMLMLTWNDILQYLSSYTTAFAVNNEISVDALVYVARYGDKHPLIL